DRLSELFAARPAHQPGEEQRQGEGEEEDGEVGRAEEDEEGGGGPGRSGSAASSLTPAMNSRSVFLASPRTIMVFGRTKRSFSIPAKPVFMLRLSTMTTRASSALNTGMP